MKEIILTQGKVALVDDSDYEDLITYKWHAARDHNTFYANRLVKVGKVKTTIGMHRQILGFPTGLKTDHIDGNGLNNQRSNLRAVTNRENLQNMHIQKSRKYPGVCIRKRWGTWIAYIKINGKRRHLGSFKEEGSAYSAYMAAVGELS
jgi:hypothetical protein